MKTLGIILLLCLSTIGYGQTEFWKAYAMNFGFQKTDSVEWVGAKDVDILIEAYEDKLVINSNKHQVYRRVATLSKNENITTWEMVDNEGEHCRMAITYLGGDDLMVMIKYEIAVWYYICKF